MTDPRVQTWWGRSLPLALVAFILPHLTASPVAVGQDATCVKGCKEITVYRRCSALPNDFEFVFGDCQPCPNTKDGLCIGGKDLPCQDYSGWFFKQQIRTVDVSLGCPCTDANNDLTRERYNPQDPGMWADCAWKVCGTKAS